MKFPEQSNPQGQRVDYCLPGPGKRELGSGDQLLTGVGAPRRVGGWAGSETAQRRRMLRQVQLPTDMTQAHLGRVSQWHTHKSCYRAGEIVQGLRALPTLLPQGPGSINSQHLNGSSQGSVTPVPEVWPSPWPPWALGIQMHRHICSQNTQAH